MEIDVSAVPDNRDTRTNETSDPKAPVLVQDVAPQDNAPAVEAVAGPDGTPITLDDLPPNDTHRWVIRRKATVVAAVRGGLLSLPDACEKWNISEEEYLSWERLIDRHGVRGLRATRLQHYRDREQKNPS